jgi:pimeloyl-ACP methyl ester carboxylesterase
MATFCLLHGNWHDPSCWEPLGAELEARGHRWIAPPVPFHDPATTHADRAQPAIDAVRGTDEALVVAHSLAASVAALVPAPQLVYLCPAPAGPFNGLDLGIAAKRPGFETPAAGVDGTSAWDRESAMAAMYPRLAPPVAAALADRLQPGSSACDAYPLARHPDVRTRVVVTRADEFFAPEWTRRAAAAIGADVAELDAGHFPMSEAPGELAALLDGYAADG